MQNDVVILGSGMAGYTVARELRKLDKGVPLTMVTADDGNVYSKPMLSNALAAGKAPADLVSADAASQRIQLGMEIITHAQVIKIDRASQRLDMADGRSIPYGRLILATGADPVSPRLGGDAADRILQVNDLEDYSRFRDALSRGKRVTILGGGLIGCEFANDLAHGGWQVSVVHPAPTPLDRLIPEAPGMRLMRALEAAGVAWHAGKKALTVSQTGNRLVVLLDDGAEIESEVVLAAIGLRPRIDLAQQAGLGVGRGIVVDAFLRTNDPSIFALGDCAEVNGQVLPYILPLMQGARALAKTLAGTTTPVQYPVMPVVVKTPACPVAAVPPRAPDGVWETRHEEDGVEAVCRGLEGRIEGFALAGKNVARKTVLTREMAGSAAGQ